MFCVLFTHQRFENNERLTVVDIFFQIAERINQLEQELDEKEEAAQEAEV